MPEHIRALIFILVLAVGVFALAKGPICKSGLLSEERYRRDRAAWFIVTIVTFLSHNFWIYAVALCAFAMIRAQKHPQPLALYVLLLFTVPPFQMLIPGIGPIEHFIAVDHYRLLNISILAPLALKLCKQAPDPARNFKIPDTLLLTLIVWMVFRQGLSDSVTQTLRSCIYQIIDIWLPYYVASRSLRDLDAFRGVAICFVLAGTIAGLVAIFESTRYWLLYESLRTPLNVPVDLPMYLLRGAGGPLRANASFGNAIVLGYVLTVVLLFAAYLIPRIRPNWIRNLTLGSLIGGLAASLSRGPWVGAAAALVTFSTLGPNTGKRIASLVFVTTALVVGLLVSPFGEKVIAYLPFVGSVESENVDYRERLFEVSLLVLEQNLWMGDVFYIQNPLLEQMRQGQGIIDIVNTYLQVALPYGLVGLTLFVAIFGIALLRVWRKRREALRLDTEAERLGRTLFSAILGALIIIATVSSIGIIPTMYWLLAGMAIGYSNLRLTDSTADSAQESIAPRRRAKVRATQAH